MRFPADLDDEQRRNVRKGLSEEILSVFDMLVEGKELSKAERGEVKLVARELLDAPKAKKLRIELRAEEEATRPKARFEVEVRHLHYQRQDDPRSPRSARVSSGYRSAVRVQVCGDA